jgi:dTDP-4-amino-4,6-dideoxy-D-galactose acyltransferase
MASLDPHGRCELLPWDSAFFGFPVARTLTAVRDERDVLAMLSWCRERGVRCLYHLSDVGSGASGEMLAANGFVVVGLRHELAALVSAVRPSGRGSPDCSIDSAVAPDAPGVSSLAREAFVRSRFRVDGRFPPDKLDALPDRWLARAAGRGEILTARVSGMLAGVATCERVDDAAQVGIMAVQPEFRGAGVGSALLVAAADRGRRLGLARLTVVTQGDNVPALRLYEAGGLRTVAVAVWHHRWFA